MGKELEGTNNRTERSSTRIPPITHEREVELVRIASQREPGMEAKAWAAFQRLETEADLQGYARCMLRRYDDDVADDFFQESLLELWKRLPMFRMECSIKSYLITILKSVIARHFKLLRNSELPVGNDILENRDHALISEDWTETVLNRESLRQILAVIPEELRGVLLLCKVEGMTLAQVGAVYGISPEGVRLRVLRCLQIIRRMLEDGTMVGPAQFSKKKPTARHRWISAREGLVRFCRERSRFRYGFY